MKQTLFYAIAVLGMMLIYWPPVMATSVVIPNGNPCPLNENATLSVTLNDTQADVETIKDRLDKEISDVQKAAKETGVEKFYVQSNNYNVGQQNFSQDKQYHLNGTITFRVEPADKALAVMAALTKKGYAAHANVNSYSNGFNCNNTVVIPPPAAIP